MPKLLIAVYLNINDPANLPIIHLTITAFMIRALAQLFDAVRNVAAGALRGPDHAGKRACKPHYTNRPAVFFFGSLLQQGAQVM